MPPSSLAALKRGALMPASAHVTAVRRRTRARQYISKCVYEDYDGPVPRGIVLQASEVPPSTSRPRELQGTVRAAALALKWRVRTQQYSVTAAEESYMSGTDSARPLPSITSTQSCSSHEAPAARAPTVAAPSTSSPVAPALQHAAVPGYTAPASSAAAPALAPAAAASSSPATPTLRQPGSPTRPVNPAIVGHSGALMGTAAIPEQRKPGIVFSSSSSTSSSSSSDNMTLSDSDELAGSMPTVKQLLGQRHNPESIDDVIGLLNDAKPGSDGASTVSTISATLAARRHSAHATSVLQGALASLQASL